MRYYNGKKNDNKEYIVIRHKIPGVDVNLFGVRYRAGYGVVAKGSKEYHRLKNVPRAVAQEFHISVLKTLNFITRDEEVNVIWGAAVYNYYMKHKELKEGETLERKVVRARKCKGQTKAGDRCKRDALKGFDYCMMHIAEDEKVKEEIDALPMMPVKERKQAIKNIVEEARAAQE